MEVAIEGKKVDLRCDCCDSMIMIMTKGTQFENEVVFSCPNCDQGYMFRPDGTYSYIKATLFPSQMKETDKMYRDEFIPWQLEQWKFIAKAKFFAGFFTKQEMEDDIKEAEKVIEDWYETHPEKPWWKFW